MRPVDRGIECPVTQRDGHLIALRQCRCAAHDRAVSQRDDRIAALQNTARADQFEGGAGVQQSLCGGLGPDSGRRCQSACRGLQTGARRGQLRRTQRRGELHEPGLTQVGAAYPGRGEPLGKLLEASQSLGPLQRGRAQEPGGGIEALLALVALATPGLHQAMTVASEHGKLLEPIGHRAHRSGRRRRCAQIGHEIGDREIGFMPDAADHRNRAGSDHPRQPLIIESPEIFDRSATAHQKQDLAFGARPRSQQGADQFGGCLSPLYGRRINDDLDLRRATRKRGQHIAQRCRLQRGHDSQRAHTCRHLAFARGLEQTLGFESRLDLKETLEEVSGASLAQSLDIELEFAARLVESCLCPSFDPITVGRIECHQLVAAPKHHRSNRRLGILKSEVPVTAGGPCQIGNLAAHPDGRETAIEQCSHRPVEFSNRHHADLSTTNRSVGAHSHATFRAESIHKRRISVINWPNASNSTKIRCKSLNIINIINA